MFLFATIITYTWVIYYFGGLHYYCYIQCMFMKIGSFGGILFLVMSLGACHTVKKAGHKDEDGFVSIFDGSTLNNWAGDTTYWRVEDGCLVGVVTPETLLKRNTFIIWQGNM